MRVLAALLLAALAAAEEDPLAPSRARVRALEGELQAVIAKVAPAVGAITNYATIFDEKTGKVAVMRQSFGSGLVVTQDGFMLTNVHVVLSVDKLQQRAEATVHTSGAELFADAVADDMYAAIDALSDKLDRQVIKHKAKSIGKNKRSKT